MEVNNFSRDINSVILKNREGHCRWGIYYTRRGHTLTWVSNFDLSASNIKVLQSTLLSSQLLKIPIDFSHRHHHRDILGLGRVSLSCVFLTLRTMCTLLVLWFCSVPNYSYMGLSAGRYPERYLKSSGNVESGQRLSTVSNTQLSALQGETYLWGKLWAGHQRLGMWRTVWKRVTRYALRKVKKQNGC